ncbi:MAG TPA: NADH:flavin oxidoreductase [Verrucomicrobiae bacterium]|jgi:2,4-dienoyl-CoA reductase-like NADH-dependent reductase (Old Yellow Enzyme family)|nr:NADH:flavin oxidoreductase [Verrucomicrobiae bacterium]
MADPVKFTRIPTLKSVDDFRAHCANLKIRLPAEDQIARGANSPLGKPIENARINGKRIGNRIGIQPMEGWDGTTSGGVTEEMLRRWTRFGESGAKIIFGGEAMAVRPDGRANPNQLIINQANRDGIGQLRRVLLDAHKARHGSTDDLVIGLQLTHSGRFSRPADKKRMEPRIAFRHPILDRKFDVNSDAPVLTDAEIEELIRAYIEAAGVAAEIGADFVDIKHCHGYLLHEFLGAHTRPGKYGGSFENRTRILREIISGIRASGNKVEIAVRLSAFDFVPFRPDPNLSQPGKPGPGIPEDFSHCLPYRYAFGINENNPVDYDLTETFRFVELCAELGVKLINLTAGSPYYNPHIQRPAAYPPSDGYQPAHDPLIDVARQIDVVRQIRARAPKDLVIIGSAYSYLQEFLPHVAQAVVRQNWADAIGLGRMTLSYPTLLADALNSGQIEKKVICRTFSDCTTAPRNGLISGCYPLDKYYTAKPEFQRLKEIKKGS